MCPWQCPCVPMPQTSLQYCCTVLAYKKFLLMFKQDLSCWILSPCLLFRLTRDMRNRLFPSSLKTVPCLTSLSLDELNVFSILLKVFPGLQSFLSKWSTSLLSCGTQVLSLRPPQCWVNQKDCFGLNIIYIVSCISTTEKKKSFPQKLDALNTCPACSKNDSHSYQFLRKISAWPATLPSCIYRSFLF